MEKSNILKRAGLCLVMALAGMLILAGCSQAVSPALTPADNIAAGLGELALRVGGAGNERTVNPDMAGVTYRITLESGALTETPDYNGGVVNVKLTPGTWDITVEAKKNDTVIGNAVGTVEIEDKKTKDVTLYLQPAAGADGTLSWSIEFPSVVDSAFIYQDDQSTPVINLLDPSVTTVINKRSGTQTFAPGAYLFRAELKNTATGKKAGKTDVVYVYPGMTSEMSWKFIETQFVSTKDLNGSVTVTYSGEVTGVTLEFADYTGEDAIVMEADAGAWKFTAPVPDNQSAADVWNNVKLNVYTAANGDTPLTFDIASMSYNASGVTLDPVTIYALTVSSVENGTVKVDGKTGSAFAYKPNASVTVTTEADAGYEFDTAASNFIDGTPITIDTDKTVTAVFKPIAVTSISIQSEGGDVGAAVTVNKGKTVQLTVARTPAEAIIGNIVWESASPAVATVEDGLVTGLTTGTADITAKIGDITDTVTVTVENKINSITITGTQWTFDINGTAKTKQLAFTIDPAELQSSVLGWSSSNTSVATVDAASGLVTAVSIGEATITAAAQDGSGKEATVKISVYDATDFDYFWTATQTGTYSISSNGTASDVQIAGGTSKWYRRSGGNITINENGLVVPNGTALVIANGSTVMNANTSPSTTFEGELDFSTPKTLYVDYHTFSATGSFSIRLNNNTGTTGYSPLALATVANGNSGAFTTAGPTSATQKPGSGTAGTFEIYINPSLYIPVLGSTVTQEQIDKAVESLDQALFCFRTDTSGGPITITGIRIEGEAKGTSGITINTEADFTDFPDDTDGITLSQTGSVFNQTLTINLTSKYDTAQWFIDGVKDEVVNVGSYMVDARNLSKGKHRLTMVVEYKEQYYSKAIEFTVTE